MLHGTMLTRYYDPVFLPRYGPEAKADAPPNLTEFILLTLQRTDKACQELDAVD
jgi:hypothetical protein